jgi:hypothetical protein
VLAQPSDCALLRTECRVKSIELQGLLQASRRDQCVFVLHIQCQYAISASMEMKPSFTAIELTVKTLTSCRPLVCNYRHKAVSMNITFMIECYKNILFLIC